jgi:uncharacterized protein YbjT (DUF2867 family)
MPPKPILVTGATGYVGGRLAPRLLEAGYRVRALGRSVAKLRGRPWGGHPHLEVAQGDLLDLESLKRAAQGCAAAWTMFWAAWRSVWAKFPWPPMECTR